MFKIKTLNAIAAMGINQFPSDSYEISSEIQKPDAILIRSHVLAENEIPDSLKVIGRAGAGINNIPVDVLTKKGIPVLNTPGANANAVKELVIAGMLLASRNICTAWQYVNELNISDDLLHQHIERHKKNFSGRELIGKTLGIIGLGNIGVKVANAALNLGMRVIGFDPTITVPRAWELSAEVSNAHSLDDLLVQADFISLHVPLVEQTKNMLNVNCFRLMKPHAILLNFAREEIINLQDLCVALDEKRIAKYVSDFPSNYFKSHPNVISLPHLGASTKEAEENCAIMIAKQVRDFLEFGSISNAVNFPHLQLPQAFSQVRLLIVNANIPNMVAQISVLLAKAGINILSLFNKSHEEIAYTVFDLSQSLTTPTINQIKNISGILQLRVLTKQKESR